jgi:hypothetical protein
MVFKTLRKPRLTLIINVLLFMPLAWFKMLVIDIRTDHLIHSDQRDKPRPVPVLSIAMNFDKKKPNCGTAPTGNLHERT